MKYPVPRVHVMNEKAIEFTTDHNPNIQRIIA